MGRETLRGLGRMNAETALRIVHHDGGRMSDTWGRPIRSGPVERWPEDDPRYFDRMDPEPCEPPGEDSCRLRSGHVGHCSPTPEQIMGWEP